MAKVASGRKPMGRLEPKLRFDDVYTEGGKLLTDETNLLTEKQPTTDVDIKAIQRQMEAVQRLKDEQDGEFADAIRSETLKAVAAYIKERRLFYRGTPQQVFVMTDEVLRELEEGRMPDEG